jgi:hypothetical protein
MLPCLHPYACNWAHTRASFECMFNLEDASKKVMLQNIQTSNRSAVNVIATCQSQRMPYVRTATREAGEANSKGKKIARAR